MHRILQNYPVITAWFAYIISAWLLKKWLGLGLVWLLKQFSFELSSNSYLPSLGMGIVVLIVAEYVGFVISIRWIAIPLSRITNTFPTKPQFGFLTFDWLSFAYYFLLFRLPLIVINEFPAFTLYIEGLPISKEVTKFIGLAWKSIVSLFVYRDIVLSSLKDMAKEHTNTSDYHVTA